jgi:predicted amidohydrolase YtcJ
MSHRPFLPRLVTFSAALLVLAQLSGCHGDPSDNAESAAAPAAVNPADLVLRGGKVATVDPAIGMTEAIAVTGYTITAVGSNADIAAYIGPATDVIELNGRLAIPGFIEGHGHYLGLGRARQILDLTQVSNWDDIVTLVGAAADRAAPGEWIFGRGWHQEKWDRVPEGAVEGLPHHAALSAVSPDNPVILTHASGHAGYANAAALAAAGIDADSADPPGGTIVRNAAGDATGLLRQSAQRLVNPAVEAYDARLTDEQRDLIMRERALLAGQEALRHGVTAFHDAGASFAEIDFFRQLEIEGVLPVRLYVMVRRQTNAELAERLPQYRKIAADNEFLTVRSIKRQIDGALGSHGAWLLEPYADLPQTHGLAQEAIEDIERTAELAVEHGFQVNTHAIGDRGNRETLDLYQRVWERMGVDGKDLRWRIEHAQHIDPEDVPRFGRLGIIAAMQGIHATSDGPWIPTRLGPQRTDLTSYPWRHLADTGAIIGNGTDVPVEPIDAIGSYYATVSRRMNTGARLTPEHVMTRLEALTSYTLNNAIAAFEEHRMGTLTPGKLADIVVLSQDILTVPEDLLPATRIDLTFLGGELRYASPEAATAAADGR